MENSHKNYFSRPFWVGKIFCILDLNSDDRFMFSSTSYFTLSLNFRDLATSYLVMFRFIQIPCLYLMQGIDLVLCLLSEG